MERLPNLQGESKKTSATRGKILEILDRNLPGPDPFLDEVDFVPDGRWSAIEKADEEDGHRSGWEDS